MRLGLAYTICVGFFAAGLLIGAEACNDTKTIDSRTTPIVATVTLAPDGTAYCPDDPATPHPLPCVNKP